MSDDKLELNRRRVLGGLATIGLASAGAGAGTMAYFSDSDDSTGNTVQAGTIDLSGGSGSDQLENVNLEPGNSASHTWTLSNSGTIDGDHVEIAASYSESDGTDTIDTEHESTTDGDSNDATADEVAKMLNITVTHEVDGDVTSSISNSGSASKTLYDLAQNGLDGLTPPSGDTDSSGTPDVDVTIDLAMDSSATNKFQNDGVDATFTFTLNQDSSQ